MKISRTLLVGSLICSSCDVKVHEIPHTNEERTRQEINTIGEALRRFRVDLGRWPRSAEGLQPLFSNRGLSRSDKKLWRGVYLRNGGLYRGGNYYDWFDRQMILTPPVDPAGPFSIVSIGKDGLRNTIDDISLTIQP